MAQMAAKPMDTEDMEDIEGSPPGNESDSNPPGAEQTESLPNKQSSPPETLDLQATLLGINSNMSKMAEIFSKMWEPPHFGSTSKDKNRIRKRPRSPSPYSSSSESYSEGEKTDHEPPTKKVPSTHKEDDRISIHASDDEMRALLRKNRPEPDIAEVQSERANDTQNEASFLQTLAHSLDDSEDTSEAIDGELAEIANKRWGKKLGPDKLKEKLGKYKRPANCTTLTPIRINNEIWTRLNTRKKTADLKVGNIQQCILKVAYANLQMASKLLQLKKPCLNPMIESAVESVAILGHASHELAARRLELVQKEKIQPTTRTKVLEQLEAIKASVSKFPAFVPTLNKYLSEKCNTFTAGRVAHFLPKWKQITSDTNIISDVTGVKIEFDTPPVQHNFKQTKFAPEEEAIIRSEISSLLAKQVIEPAEHEPGEIISNIFLRPKKDGSHRLILNLKELNQSVSYVHFKMETLSSILKLVEQNAFMAAVDLKDAYYSVPVCKEDRKYLRFWWDGQLYQFTCLPNGLSSAPRLFTKILKPPLTSLHKEGHIVSGYLDDLCLQGSTYEECITNVIDTIKLLEELGFVVHSLKSVLIPSQEIEILGFVINTVSMTVELTLDKKESLSNNCKALLSTPVVLIRELAQVIGKIVSSFPGVMHGPLYYRYLERDKTIALRNNQGDFDAYTPLSDEAVSELNWWINKVDSVYNVISHENPSLTITTDASHIGWGAVCDNIPTGGNWKFEESQWHINELETLAAFIGIKSFAKKQENQHIRIRSDNTTCISAINHMGPVIPNYATFSQNNYGNFA